MPQAQIEKYIRLCNENASHQTIGVKAVSLDTKQAVCELSLKKWHLNIEDCIYGGVLFSLMDTTMALSVYPHLTKEERILAVEVKINYIKAATMDMKKVKGIGILVSRTRRLAVAEGEIVDGKGNILCKAMGTFAILKSKGE